MRNHRSLIIDFFILLIITVPAFWSLLNNQYFSMHDDQHIVRLFLFDQGIKQELAYPRWVDGLGFGYGYPLFNFYPPMIYFVAEAFHLLGFSLIWSIKLLIITGYILAAIGIFLFVKTLTNKLAGYLSAALYTYFFYHAVTVYVRGAFAEFFSLTVLPWVFYMMLLLAKKPDIRKLAGVAIFVATLLLSHPLISFPSLFYIGVCGLFFMYSAQKHILKYISYLSIGLLVGATMASFFWLPSLTEKKYTMVDDILTRELANYKIHYIDPFQFLYSSWGYGGSGPGLNDGMTFQLGKAHIFLGLAAVILCIAYWILLKKKDVYFFVWVSLLGFSIFMSIPYSSFIWDNISFLWYLQFPWRYLTFIGLWLSVIGAYSIFFTYKILNDTKNKVPIPIETLTIILVVFLTLITVGVYSKYFRPERYRAVSDLQLTSEEEIKWRISSTSFEFVPKGVKTKKSELNTTILDIDKTDIQKSIYTPFSFDAVINLVKNTFTSKTFTTQADDPYVFQLNTYNFPGWKAYLDNRQIMINDNNDLKLIQVEIPAGKHEVSFRFENTPIRSIANVMSVVSILLVLILLLKPILK